MKPRTAGQIVNATIDKTLLGFEGHGIFTSFIYVDYGDGGHQGFGDYVLGGEFGCEYLKKVLEVAGVESWEDLVGQNIRVKYGDEPAGWGNRIAAIGHITRDIWLDPKKLGEKYAPKDKKE